MADQLNPEFVRKLLASQNRLFAYLLSLVGSEHDAEDLLQQTNMVLCKKAAQAAAATSFEAWACRVAHLETLNFRRSRARDPHQFDDELVRLLASEASKTLDNMQDRLAALSQCVDELAHDQRELVTQRYRPGQTVRQMAADSGRTVNAVSVALLKIRKKLLECVRRKLARHSTET